MSRKNALKALVAFGAVASSNLFAWRLLQRNLSEQRSNSHKPPITRQYPAGQASSPKKESDLEQQFLQGKCTGEQLCYKDYQPVPRKPR